MRIGLRIGCAALVLVLAAAIQPAAQAAVHPWGEAALQLHYCDQDSSAHPVRVTMRQVVTTNTLKGVGELELIMQYSFDAAPGNDTIPVGETIKGRIRVFRTDGTRIDLGLMEATVTSDGVASATKLVDVSLEEGDVVRWRFTFRGFPAMDELDTLLMIGVVTKPGIDS